METRDKKGKFVVSLNIKDNVRLYNTWNHMRHRVRKECKHKFTHLYYGKGIDLCDEWKDFLVFKDWALANGYTDKLEIDRIDNSKGYHPENCRWVTRKENCNNRDVTMYVDYNGERQALKILLDKLGKDSLYFTIIRRILRGWSGQKAIDTPIRKGNYFRSNDYVGLTEQQKQECVIMHSKGINFTDIAKKFNSNRKAISKIVKS